MNEKINLHHYLGNLTSCHGENGILVMMFDVLGIKEGKGLEVGAGNGILRSNLYPLIYLDWEVIFVEADDKLYTQLESNMREYKHVVCENKRISLKDGERLDDILDKHDFPYDFDVLSLDIDGNDYWIWKELTYKPKIVLIEYNRDLIPPCVQKYDENHKYEKNKP